jgi:hypothetical protein
MGNMNHAKQHFFKYSLGNLLEFLMISFYVYEEAKQNLEDIVRNSQDSALLKNQSFAFKFLCENFQPKLINSYSNF